MLRQEGHQEGHQAVVALSMFHTIASRVKSGMRLDMMTVDEVSEWMLGAPDVDVSVMGCVWSFMVMLYLCLMLC